MSSRREGFPYYKYQTVVGYLVWPLPVPTLSGVAYIVKPSASDYDNQVAISNLDTPGGYDFYAPIKNWPVVNAGIADGSGDTVMYFNGAEWVVSAVGPDAPSGPAGLDGQDGVDGRDGAQGQAGTAGPSGATGSAGNDGRDGDTGNDGRDGLQGQDGATGATGATGAAGPQGGTGNTGADGLDGADGRDGLQGNAGAAGSTGPAGPQGNPANDGRDGDPGEPGRDGIPGATVGIVPIGGIIMYSGAFAAIPAEFHLCDGTGGTPNLTDKFIKGTNTAGELGNTGGAANHTPAGTNSAPTFTGDLMSTHDHGGLTDAANAETANVMDGGGFGIDVPSTRHAHVIFAQSAGTPSGAVSAPAFTGTSADYQPAWYKLAFIMRII